MVRVIMHGCNGVMGQVITGMAKDMEGLTIVALILKMIKKMDIRSMHP